MNIFKVCSLRNYVILVMGASRTSSWHEVCQSQGAMQFEHPYLKKIRHLMRARPYLAQICPSSFFVSMFPPLTF